MARSSSVVLGAVLAVMLCSASVWTASAARAERLVFSDDFSSLNMTRWKHAITAGGGGNWEFEYYHNNRSNSFVQDGVLYIKPTLTADRIGEGNLKAGYTLDLWGGDPASMCTSNAWFGCQRTSGAGGNVLNPIQSARLRTAESFHFKYGRVEVKAKLPRGDWLWPAIWMLPRYQAYGIWPASGEIDIMESRGNDASYPAGGNNQFGSTLHWGPFDPQDPFNKTHKTYTLPSGDLTTGFHTYGLIWNETTMMTYIDSEDQVVLYVDLTKETFWERGGWGTTYDNPWAGGGHNAPFDQEFYLIFNVACGGTAGYFPDGVGGKPWSNSDSHAVNAFWDAKDAWYSTWGNGTDAAMAIDSVNVWQY